MKISLLVIIIIKKNLIQKKITKSLKKLRNKFININEFKEEYNKFMDNFKNFKDFKSDKKPGGVSQKPKIF